MENLSEKFNNLKQSYREIFLEVATDINLVVEKLKPENLDGCIFDDFSQNPVGLGWQNDVLKYFDNVVLNEISSGLSEVKTEQKKYNCNGCGTCCRFACSEFSYEELKLKAKNGDVFAEQFISVFVPYESMDEVKLVFGEYVDFLKNNAEFGYYFYHCPKVTSENKCPDYENRPQICRDFPDNPIAFLPKNCGFMDWKLKSERVLLKLNALAEIVEFYKSKIKGNM